MRVAVAAIALSAMLVFACGGDSDDDDVTPTTSAGTTATQPAETTTLAAGGDTPTPDGPGATTEPVDVEPTFTCDSPISILEARGSTGEEVQFQERVFEIEQRAGDVVLAVGAPFDATLRVEIVIPAAAVDDFAAPPEQAFANRVVCARGTVESVDGVTTIYAQSSEALTVVAE